MYLHMRTYISLICVFVITVFTAYWFRGMGLQVSVKLTLAFEPLTAISFKTNINIHINKVQNTTYNYTSYNYHPQISCGKVNFLHLSVILSTGGGVCLPQSMLRYTHTHLADTPSGRQYPWQTPPPSRRLLQQTVRILLECILVFNYYYISHVKCIEVSGKP